MSAIVETRAAIEHTTAIIRRTNTAVRRCDAGLVETKVIIQTTEQAILETLLRLAAIASRS